MRLIELQNHQLVYIHDVCFISSHGEAAVYEYFRQACDC